MKGKMVSVHLSMVAFAEVLCLAFVGPRDRILQTGLGQGAIAAVADFYDDNACCHCHYLCENLQ
jgi:hypothetical protein